MTLFEKCNTTTEQGNIGEAAAILHFTKIKAIVSKPLFNNCPYDLIVDIQGTLNRVQIKTTEQRAINHKHFVVNLKTSGSNARVNNTVPFDPSKVDMLFVLADNGQCWTIPTKSFKARHTLTLSEAYDVYIV